MQNKFHVAGCHRLPSTAGQTAKADNSVMLFCKLKTKKKIAWVHLWGFILWEILGRDIIYEMV
jgi:hypothetical protein